MHYIEVSDVCPMGTSHDMSGLEIVDGTNII